MKLSYTVEYNVTLSNGKLQLGPHLIIRFDMEECSLEEMYDYMNNKMPFGRIIDTGYTGSQYNWKRLQNSPEYYEFAIKE